MGILLLLAAGLFSDQITKIAVVDYNRILSVYYEDSRYIRQITQFEEDIKKEITEIDRGIKQMEADLLEARRTGDDRKVLSLESSIEDRKDYLTDFIKIKRTQLAEMRDRLSTELDIVDELLDAMQYVAESNGFSIIFRKDDPSVLWYSYDVDITDAVLKYLMANR